MDVFLAGIIQGSNPALDIHPQRWRERATRALLQYHPDAQIYDHFAVHSTSVDYRGDRIATTLQEGIDRAAAADVVVCWLPEASMGTALEMARAYEAGALVLSITPMAANWVIQVYSHSILPDLEAFETFLAAGGLRQFLAERSG